MYKVYDYLECFEGDLLGTFETLKEAKQCMKQQVDDTDGDCFVVITKDNKPIDEKLYI